MQPHKRVPNINLPGIQIPSVDTAFSWQYMTFLYYGYTPVLDPFFFWRESGDSQISTVYVGDSTFGGLEAGDETSTWDSMRTAEPVMAGTNDSSTTWTKLSETFDRSGED